MTGNLPGPAAVLSRQYSYKTDRIVGVTGNSVLAIYPAYRYAREVEVCMTIVWLCTCCYTVKTNSETRVKTFSVKC